MCECGLEIQFVERAEPDVRPIQTLSLIHI